MKPETEKAFEAWYENWGPYTPEIVGALRDAFSGGASHERKLHRDTVAPFDLDGLAQFLHALAEDTTGRQMARITLKATAALVECLRQEEQK